MGVWPALFLHDPCEYLFRERYLVAGEGGVWKHVGRGCSGRNGLGGLETSFSGEIPKFHPFPFDEFLPSVIIGTRHVR
jgi:hypothetical protein